MLIGAGLALFAAVMGARLIKLEAPVVVAESEKEPTAAAA